MKKNNKNLNTWSVTSKFNNQFLSEFHKNKFLLKDSDLKGLCSIDSYPDTNFLTIKDVEDINKFENSLYSKPHKSINKFNKRLKFFETECMCLI